MQSLCKQKVKELISKTNDVKNIHLPDILAFLSCTLARRSADENAVPAALPPMLPIAGGCAPFCPVLA
jgi:hypothetical protein